jgi:hypothetical protein
MNRRLRPLGPIALFAASLFAACSDSPVGSAKEAVTATGCSARGTVHSGEVEGTQHWTRAAGPHLLIDTVYVRDTLTIEAGALVCAAPGARLVAMRGQLHVMGTSAQPVVFTALDSTRYWAGIIGQGVMVRHAEIRYAEIGLWTEGGVIEDTYIHNCTNRGISAGGGVVLRRLRIEECGVAVLFANGTLTMEHPIIRNSRSVGIFVVRRATLDLTGGEITGSTGPGLVIAADPGGSARLVLHEPVRITGGANVPAVVTGSAAAQLTRDAETSKYLVGNAVDALDVIDFDFGGGVVSPDLAWRVTPLCWLPSFDLGTFVVQAGATLDLQMSRCPGGARGQLIGQGTEAAPATIRGDNLSSPADLRSDDTAPDTIRLTHTRISGVNLRMENRPVVFEDVVLEASRVRIGSDGSRIVRSRIHGSTADAVTITAAVVLSECTVEDNARHGIRVEAGSPRVHQCNIRRNGGAGISNVGTGVVDAAHNWWGDAAGPAGPEGDGIEGNVLFVPFLTTPRE